MLPKKSLKKLNYFSPNLWRLIYLIKSNPIYHSREKRIFNKSSSIPHLFRGYETVIHSGKKYKKRVINRWQVGFKFGNFTWNRSIAKYKAKQSKKKKKK